MRSIRYLDEPGDMVILQILVLGVPRAIRIVNSHGDSTLMIAAAVGNLELLALLVHISRHVDLSKKSRFAPTNALVIQRNNYGFSSAMIASFYAQRECMDFLLDNVPESHRSEEVFHCLLAACASPCEHALSIVLHLLEKHEAPVNRVNSKGLHALIVCQRRDVKKEIESRTCEHSKRCMKREEMRRENHERTEMSSKSVLPREKRSRIRLPPLFACSEVQKIAETVEVGGRPTREEVYLENEMELM